MQDSMKTSDASAVTVSLELSYLLAKPVEA